jgi:hypothetical protein
VNGLGQTYADCAPQGTPGVAAGYSQALALEAAGALPLAGATVAGGTCAGDSCVAKSNASYCAVWCYTGASAGYTIWSSSPCACPTAGIDGTWD